MTSDNIAKRLLRGFRSEYTRDEKAVLLLIASVFFSVYAVGLSVLALAVYLIYTGEIRRVFLEVKGSGYLLLFGVFMLLATTAHGKEMEMVVALGVLFILLAGLYLRYAMTARIFDDMLDLVCLLSIGSMLVALFQKYVLVDTPFGDRLESVFYNPNYYAAVIEIVLLFAIYRFLTREQNRLFYAAVIACNLGGLALAECRTALAVVAVAVPVLLLLLRRKAALFFYMGFACLAAIVIVSYPDILPRVDALDGDFDTRISIWKASLLGFTDHPLLGGGMLTYSRMHGLYGGYNTTHAHNLLLEMLLNFGMVGTGVAAVYYWKNVRAAIWNILSGVDRRRSVLLLAVVFAVLAHGVVDATLFWPQTGLLVAAVLGCPGIYEKEESFGLVPAIQPYKKQPEWY